VDLRTVQHLLGHNSLTTTARYTRLTKITEQNADSSINQLAEQLTLQWEVTNDARDTD
jgi:site-specific recombinase XerC